MRDLPPPLFCRPRKSPKFISDSKQPSISCITNFGASDNRSIICESRRQSNAATQRNDIDGTNSMQGSSSPFISRHRKIDSTPLYINNNDSEMLTASNDDTYEDLRKDELNGSTEDSSKKQIAMVRPQTNMLNSRNSSTDEISKKLFLFKIRNLFNNDKFKY